MKVCTKCGVEKSLTNFHFKNKAIDLRRTWCITCVARYHRKHYLFRAQYYKDKRRRYRHEMRVLAQEAKNRPCDDCGGAFPYYVMHFDHLPGHVKLGEVSRLVATGIGRQALVDEIAKCDVVCANCHAVRGYNRQFKSA